VVSGAFLGSKLLSLNPFRKSVYGGKKFRSMAWEVVEWYISGPKGYEKTDTVPVVVIDEEKEKTHKTWYNTFYNKLFGGLHKT